MVIECLTSQAISRRCILQAEEMRSVRLQLEEDTISYLSLIPDSISSCKIVNGDYFKMYLREAHDTVNAIRCKLAFLIDKCLKFTR